MGIWIAAAITTVLATLSVGGVLYRATKETVSARGVLLVAVLLTTPACAAALFGFREPVLHKVWLALAGLGHPGLDAPDVKKTLLYGFLRMFDAPVGEELAKLWPLAIPWFRRELAKHEPARVGMALGLGFGLGEIWVVAWITTKSPAMSALPFWAFGGFLFERLLVCFMHGAFTATALRRWGKGFGWGLLGAMTLHFVGNFPIFFRIIGKPALSQAAWAQVLTFWVIGYACAMLALLSRYLLGKVEPGELLYGRGVCKVCHTEYSRPLLLAMNVGARRYERCNACGKWQWQGG